MPPRITVFLLVWLILSPALSGGMKVGTYNIRYDNPGDVENGNQWTRRAPVIASLVRFHDFDVLGTQEGFHHQMEDLLRLLPEYACVSYGRSDGKLKGEHTGIVYRKDRYEVRESGMFWLSETPDRPGRGWDAGLPRICSWARMRRIPDGATFCFMSVHLDHRGKLARMESAKLLLAKSATLAGADPVFLVGDFNADQHSGAYRFLTAEGALADAAETAEVRYLPNGTANRFDPHSKTESRIDHIFTSPGTRVRRFGVLTDSYRVTRDHPRDSASGNFPKEVRFRESEARLPSDHFPVLAETADP